MQTHNRNPFMTIHSEGALLPTDLLQRIVAGDAALDGLSPQEYHLTGDEKINEAINRSWNRLQGAWASFMTARENLPDSDIGTSATREKWLLHLFNELGYGRLQIAKAVSLDGKDYRISHGWSGVPIHLVGFKVDLDRRQPGVTGAAKSSPHSLLQEFLNRTPDQLWGFLSNGLVLRVLRDNASLTRQAYLEFDLEAMFTGEIYADYVVLWLVCHQSRVETKEGHPESCWLEKWSKNAQDQGTRALEKLREGVETAIAALGSGFLSHPANTDLKQRLRSGELSKEDYYRQLLRLVYRMILLFAAEDRNLLFTSDTPPLIRERYMRYYSATRLRHLAEQTRGGRHPDLYASMRLVFAILGGREISGTGQSGLGLPVLGSFLFSNEATPDLETAELENNAILSAVRSLAFILDGRIRRVVDYRNLGMRELGSVYESLLELQPEFNTDAGTFSLITTAGSERKTTGSYYTPEELINVLLDSALDPVVEDRLKGLTLATEQEQALLDLNVCDPACGSGHFLIAAAHRIARRLAQIRSGDEEPSPDMTRIALRDTIRHCIYGVDINPMSVELCKVNLWLESLEPGKPLSFLDAHIRCGNSLVGVGPGMTLHDLEIPDDAFSPVTGDDRPTASLLKKRNKSERQGQEGLFVTIIKTKEDLDRWLAERTRALEAMPEESAEQVQAKSIAYLRMNESAEYRLQRNIADLWTAAFFWKIEKPAGNSLEIVAPTHGQLLRLRRGQTVQTGLVDRATALGLEQGFFHWPLEFPEITEQGGFDCVLGNPPWDMLQFNPTEFFSSYSHDIVNAKTFAIREKLISGLQSKNPILYKKYIFNKHNIEGQQKFVHSSDRFPLTSYGRINLMSLFTETATHIISNDGYIGIVVPIGIATDSYNQYFFSELIKSQTLQGLCGFENESFIFPEVHHSFKFCALSISGTKIKTKSIDFIFFCRDFSQINQKEKHFSLCKDDFNLINPNTMTCPIFRTNNDAELTKKIYKTIPVLLNENISADNWGFKVLLMFMMNTDSHLFQIENRDDRLPLFEAKMIHQYNHRFATYQGATKANLNSGILPQSTEKDKINPKYEVMPKFWVNSEKVDNKLTDWPYNWLLGFRDITSSVVERTAIFSILPRTAVGNKIPVLLFTNATPILFACFIANGNSLTFDYVARQKISGMSLNFYILKQLPVFPPKSYSNVNLSYIIPRVLELVYTSSNLIHFANDIWDESNKELRNSIINYYESYFQYVFRQKIVECSSLKDEIKDSFKYPYSPFQWNNDHRSIVRAELDAYYAALYGMNHKQLRYILDPADLTPRELEDILDPWEEIADPLYADGYAARSAASDFPGETFRVLKDKENRQFGEYRTRRLVLEAWERLKASGELPEPAVAVTAESEFEPISEVQPKQEIVHTDMFPEIKWLPIETEHLILPEATMKATSRQAIGVAWIVINYGTGQSIPLFDAQKYSYFIQRKKLADLDIPFKEFAKGPYSPEVTYKAGTHAKKISYWEVKSKNVVRGRNINDALSKVDRVISDIDAAKQLIDQLSTLSKEDLGGFATVDFASRAVFDAGQTIDPENIRTYFQINWPEKVNDAWYTDENINRALEFLSEIGLFQKSDTSEISKKESDEQPEEQTIQPMLTDFSLYKCASCGKLVMGYDLANHEQEAHAGKKVEWKNMR